MGILVKDLLKLDLFKESQIIAGHNGLNKIINRVSVFDCPIEESRDRVVLQDGDFFISNFFFFKESIEYGIYAINFLDSCKCSGLCITSEYLDCFSEELINHCNKINFPILTIDYSTSYGDIIRDVAYLLFKNEKNYLLESQLANLMNTYSLLDSKKILNTINPHFLDYITAIYFYSSNTYYNYSSDFLNLLNQNKNNICIPYKNGFILIISYYKDDLKSIESTISYYSDIIKNNVDKYIIGISNNFIDLVDARTAISQSILCLTSMNKKPFSIIRYKELGIIPWLFSYKDTPEIKNYYQDIINPIKEYDDKYNKDLLKTLIAFVECNGDYKTCSRILYQHENTIRYRILKIKSLLNLEDSSIEFYEKISICIKLHKIYNNFSI